MTANLETMIALFRKEIRYFFTSAVGYVVMGIFILCNSLFLWILRGSYNIFESGFADLQPFFILSSWIFVFLIPAITMRTISEEKRTGMLSLLLTKPITPLQFIFGKYLGVLVLIFSVLIPTIIYVYMMWQLGNPVGNLDIATTIGSYLALFLLASSFASVGVWASSISQNQIVAFVLATFLNFFLFYGLDEIISLIAEETFIYFGFKNHFEDISRGVIDTRNVIYFGAVIAFFLYLAMVSVKRYRD